MKALVKKHREPGIWMDDVAEPAVGPNDVLVGGLTLKGIYGREMFETWYRMLSLLQSGLNLGPVATHRFHFSDYELAFRTMASGQSGKVVLNWSAEDGAEGSHRSRPCT